MGKFWGCLCLLSLLLGGLVRADDSAWRLALPGWTYAFPRDHRPHREFKTEWWYFTGNLRDTEGRQFGYQLTLFRQGVRPPGSTANSRFVIDDLKFSHFAVSDIAGGQFYCWQKLSRGAFGEAGFGEGPKLAWMENWTVEMDPDETFRLRAGAGEVELELGLKNVKVWTEQGVNGVSQKADGAGHASHYYSGTRMTSTGHLRIGSRKFVVTGESWFDHEWATNQLTPQQVGWNWFSIQLGDGTELMIYQMRLKDGGIDPNSSGTFVAKDGTTRHLRRDDYQLVPLRQWTSKKTGARYPLTWRLQVPSLGFDLEVTTPLDSQELVFTPLSYWEGLIEVQGKRDGQDVRGHGYMELTGYSGALIGLGK